MDRRAGAGVGGHVHDLFCGQALKLALGIVAGQGHIHAHGAEVGFVHSQQAGILGGAGGGLNSKAVLAGVGFVHHVGNGIIQDVLIAVQGPAADAHGFRTAGGASATLSSITATGGDSHQHTDCQQQTHKF